MVQLLKSKPIILNFARFTTPGIRSLVAGCGFTLTRSGLQTGRGNRWTKERVTSLRSYNEIPKYMVERRQAEGWMNLTEAAGFLCINSRTLRIAVEQGEIPAEHPLAAGPWVFRRSVLEADSATRLVARVRQREQAPAVPTANQATLDFSACPWRIAELGQNHVFVGF
jgi:hypothetical protein